MKNLLQINYWTLGGFEGAKPPEQALAEAQEMGFEGVELTFGAGHFAPGISDKRCQEIKAEARKLGMKIETLATGFYWVCSLSDPNPEVRKRAVAFTADYLRVAALVGAKVILVVPGAVAITWEPLRPIVPYATVWKNATASIQSLVSVARKHGVSIGLENVWNWFLQDPIAMKTFIDQFRGDWVRCYLDLGNCLVNGCPEHWIEILGDRIAAVHAKNYHRKDGGGTLKGFATHILRGDLDWNAVLSGLKEIGYKGPITTEVLPSLPQANLDLARDTAVKMRRLLGKG